MKTNTIKQVTGASSISIHACIYINLTIKTVGADECKSMNGNQQAGIPCGDHGLTRNNRDTEALGF